MSLTLRVKAALESQRVMGWDWTIKSLVEDLENYIQNHKETEERHEQILVEAYKKHKVKLLIALQEYQYE